MYGRFYNYIVRLCLSNRRGRRNLKIINGRFEIVSELKRVELQTTPVHEERSIIKPTDLTAYGIGYDIIPAQYYDVCHIC
jgi:hypothetical protein